MSDCCNCYFLTRAQFAPEISMPENIDDARVLPSIIDTQETFIRPLLCEDLYDEICQQIKDDEVTEANEDLLCYIRATHKRYAFADFLQRQQIVVVKESIVRKVSNESEFVDTDSIANNIRLYMNHAQTYAGRLIKFLRDNADTYPLWANCRCSCGSGTRRCCDNHRCDSYCPDYLGDNNSSGFF